MTGGVLVSQTSKLPLTRSVDELTNPFRRRVNMIQVDLKPMVLTLLGDAVQRHKTSFARHVVSRGRHRIQSDWQFNHKLGRLDQVWFWLRFGFTTKTMIIPKMINISSNMIFRFVVFFWYPVACVISINAGRKPIAGSTHDY